MVNPSASPEAAPILQLLTDYSFDSENCQAEAVVTGWLQQFETVWVNQAITEALYQGRYKLVSVEHILQLWQRRGHPLRHFNREFESIVLGQTLLCHPPSPPAHDASVPSATTSEASSPVDHTDHQAFIGEAISSVEGSDSVVTDSPAKVVTCLSDSLPAPNPFSDSNAQATVPNFRPVSPDLSPNWTPAETIQPFVPQLTASEFHQRLKAVVEGGLSDR